MANAADFGFQIATQLGQIGYCILCAMQRNQAELRLSLLQALLASARVRALLFVAVASGRK